MLTCKSCGGTYDPIGADGMAYFHSCPPLSLPELKAALTGGAVRLSAAFAQRLKAAQDADAARPPDAAGPLAVDELLATIVVERPNKRDENILGGRGDDRHDLRAEGAGVDAAAAPAPDPPIVLTGPVPRDAVLP